MPYLHTAEWEVISPQRHTVAAATPQHGGNIASGAKRRAQTHVCYYECCADDSERTRSWVQACPTAPAMTDCMGQALQETAAASDRTASCNAKW